MEENKLQTVHHALQTIATLAIVKHSHNNGLLMMFQACSNLVLSPYEVVANLAKLLFTTRLFVRPIVSCTIRFCCNDVTVIPDPSNNCSEHNVAVAN